MVHITLEEELKRSPTKPGMGETVQVFLYIYRHLLA